MYKNFFIQYFALLILAVTVASSQPFGPPGGGHPGPGHERVQRFKKMRLIEVLKLNEDESVRFFAKQNAHEEKVRDMIKSRNTAIDEIETKVRDKADAKELQKLSTSVMEIDDKVFAERKRFQDEIRNFLTPEQFGKFLVFERNFEHRLRESMDEMMQGRPRRGHKE